MSDKQKVIGILGDTLFFDIPVAILRAVRDTAAEHGYKTVYFTSGAYNTPDKNHVMANTFFNMITHEIIDGLVVISSLLASHSSTEEFRQLLEGYSPLPVISLGLEIPEIPSVISGNKAGIFSAVNHFVKHHGYTKIAFLKGTEGHPDVIERYEAFEQAIRDNNLEPDPELVLPGNFQVQSGAEAMSILLDERKKVPGKDVEAIICCNDYMVFGAMQVLNARGIKVPEDIALSGYDDIRYSSCISPSITTIRQPFTEMAEKAAELLIGCIEGQNAPPVTVIDSVFTARGSCGCADPDQDSDDSGNEDLPADLLESPQKLMKYLNRNIPGTTIKFIEDWKQMLVFLNHYETESLNSGNTARQPCFSKEMWSMLGTALFRSSLDAIYSQSVMRLGVQLSSTLELVKQIDVLRQIIPSTGMKHCAICLFDEPEKYNAPAEVPPLSKLIFYYNPAAPLTIPDGGIYFNTLSLLPHEVMDTARSLGWVALMLYFGSELIGYALLDIDIRDESTHYFIRVQLSGALKGSLLLQENRKHLEQLANANATIKAFNDELLSENLRFKAEMDLARNIQTALLPRDVKHIHKDFEIAAKMITAEEVGGDYYDITLDDHGALWLGIGDVSGHGVKPGLIMMLAKTIHSTITTHYCTDPASALKIINRVMIKNVMQRMQVSNYMTCVLLKYLNDGRFQYAGMHLDLLIYRKKTKKCESIGTEGIWLNVIDDFEKFTKNNEFTLNPGDTLVLYTDGISEARNARKHMLDVDGLIGLIERYGEYDVEEMCKLITKAACDWYHGKQSDDISLLICRRKG